MVDRRIELPARVALERFLIGVAHGERHIDAVVVGPGVEIRDVHIGAEGDKQVLERVAAERHGRPELGRIQLLEPGAQGEQRVLHRGTHRGVTGGLGAGHVVEGVDEEDEVFLARRGERHAPGFHRNTQRVLAAAQTGRVAFPAHEPDILVGGLDPALEGCGVEVGRRIALGDQGGRRPVGHVVHIAGAPDLGDFRPVAAAPRVEEERAVGRAGPGKGGRRVEDAGDLEARVEHVLIQ